MLYVSIDLDVRGSLFRRFSQKLRKAIIRFVTSVLLSVRLSAWNKSALTLRQRFSNFFQVGTTFISPNVLRTTLLLGLSNSLGLP